MAQCYASAKIFLAHALIASQASQMPLIHHSWEASMKNTLCYGQQSVEAFSSGTLV